MMTVKVIWMFAAYLLAAQDGATFFSVSHDPGYPKPENTLAELVNAQAKHRVNHFCAVGYRYPDNDQQAWVWWKEGNAIILWEGTIDPRYPSSLLQSSRFLRLNRDVAETDEDLHGSTYRVSKAWVAQVESDCQQHGDQFVIEKTTKQGAHRNGKLQNEGHPQEGNKLQMRAGTC